MKQEESLYDMFPPLWTDVKPVTPLKFSLCGLVIPLMSAATTVIKMCPPLTLKNLQAYQPLVAIGCPNGAVHIVDVADGMLKKEIAVHNYPVKGDLWHGRHPWAGQGDMSSLLFKISKKFKPDGRVVSAAEWQARGPEFDSHRSQNIFRKNQEF